MNSFESVKLVLYRENDLKYPVASRILDESIKKKIQTERFNNDDDLSSKLVDLKKKYNSKEIVILREFMGRKFQKCPGSPGVICCNYYLLNTCFNCLFNCTYCFLNSYLNSYGIVQFVNLDDLTELIKAHCLDAGKAVRIGTGEFTDSLMFDEVTSIASQLIETTSDIPNLFLEFKTKSSRINHLKDIRNKGNTVLAWSVNTQKNIDLYEEGASGIIERIDAAAEAQCWGYNTAFHFDPIIMHDNFLDEYFKVIEMMAGKLDASKVIWISLGCFRYSQGFKEIIKNSFPAERLTTAEMFPGRDGKYRYLAPERTEIFKRFKEKIEIHFPDVFIYLCMEDSEIWYKVFSKDYNKSDDLENDFNIYLQENFMK